MSGYRNISHCLDRSRTFVDRVDRLRSLTSTVIWKIMLNQGVVGWEEFAMEILLQGHRKQLETAGC